MQVWVCAQPDKRCCHQKNIPKEPGAGLNHHPLPSMRNCPWYRCAGGIVLSRLGAGSGIPHASRSPLCLKGAGAGSCSKPWAS